LFQKNFQLFQLFLFVFLLTIFKDYTQGRSTSRCSPVTWADFLTFSFNINICKIIFLLKNIKFKQINYKMCTVLFQIFRKKIWKIWYGRYWSILLFRKTYLPVTYRNVIWRAFKGTYRTSNFTLYCRTQPQVHFKINKFMYKITYVAQSDAMCNVFQTFLTSALRSECALNQWTIQ